METFSEAIRAGAKLRPQCFGRYTRSLENDQIGTDVYGAAYEALFGELPPEYVPGGFTSEPGWAVLNHFKIDYWMEMEHPITHETWMINFIITDLEDKWGWTRERIADYLATKGL